MLEMTQFDFDVVMVGAVEAVAKRIGIFKTGDLLTNSMLEAIKARDATAHDRLVAFRRAYSAWWEHSQSAQCRIDGNVLEVQAAHSFMDNRDAARTRLIEYLDQKYPGVSRGLRDSTLLHQGSGMEISCYDNEAWRITRLIRAANRIPVATIAKMEAIHDHKGNLELTFSTPPSQEDLRACASAWSAEGECVFGYRTAAEPADALLSFDKAGNLARL